MTLVQGTLASPHSGQQSIIVDNNNQTSLDSSKETIEKWIDGNIAIVSHLSFCVVPK